MKDNYPYFKDPRALAEIRKHKWLESQKQGQEVGFATVALDWIEKYGQQWKAIHVDKYKDNRIFIEQRKYRRFNFNQVIKLVRDNIVILAEGINISFFGLMCRIREFVPVDSKLNIYIPLEQANGEKVIGKGTLVRSIRLKPENYAVFFKFDSECRQKIENCQYFRD